MNYIKLFEDFIEGKFNLEDMENCFKSGKKIFATVIKGLPENDPKTPLSIVNIDKDTGEIGVEVDSNIYYLDIKNVEDIEK